MSQARFRSPFPILQTRSRSKHLPASPLSTSTLGFAFPRLPGSFSCLLLFGFALSHPGEVCRGGSSVGWRGWCSWAYPEALLWGGMLRYRARGARALPACRIFKMVQIPAHRCWLEGDSGWGQDFFSKQSSPASCLRKASSSAWLLPSEKPNLSTARVSKHAGKWGQPCPHAKVPLVGLGSNAELTSPR